MIPLTHTTAYCCVNHILVRQEARPVLRSEVYSEFEPYTETQSHMSHPSVTVNLRRRDLGSSPP